MTVAVGKLGRRGCTTILYFYVYLKKKIKKMAHITELCTQMQQWMKIQLTQGV